MWRNWNACLLLAVTEDGSRLWETCWLALKNLNIESSCDPAIPLWTHTQMSWKQILKQVYACPSMLMATLLTLHKRREKANVFQQMNAVKLGVYAFNRASLTLKHE